MDIIVQLVTYFTTTIHGPHQVKGNMASVNYIFVKFCDPMTEWTPGGIQPPIHMIREYTACYLYSELMRKKILEKCTLESFGTGFPVSAFESGTISDSEIGLVKDMCLAGGKSITGIWNRFEFAYCMHSEAHRYMRRKEDTFTNVFLRKTDKVLKQNHKNDLGTPLDYLNKCQVQVVENLSSSSHNGQTLTDSYSYNQGVNGQYPGTGANYGSQDLAPLPPPSYSSRSDQPYSSGYQGQNPGFYGRQDYPPGSPPPDPRYNTGWNGGSSYYDQQGPPPPYGYRPRNNLWRKTQSGFSNWVSRLGTTSNRYQGYDGRSGNGNYLGSNDYRRY